MDVPPRTNVSARRIWLARGIAVAADAVQIALFPFFAIPTPFEPVLDIVVALAMIFLVGWHIAFLPSFIIEQFPIADLAPTWTIAIFIATRGHRPVDSACSLSTQPHAPRKLLGDIAMSQPWHDNLAKPHFTPATWVTRLFGGMIYPVMIVSFGVVLVWGITGAVSWLVVLPFVIHILAHLVYGVAYFGVRDLPIAMASKLIMLATLIWAMLAVWPYAPLIAILLLPYLVWLCVTTSVQIGITHMNREHA